MQNKEKITGYFTSDDFKKFINQHKGADVAELLLRFSSSDDLKLRHFASQLALYEKARLKMPTHVDKLCLFTTKAYEQASSESTAIYKASLYTGKSMLDLSGGLGVDDWAFAGKFDEVISSDPDMALNDIARFNFLQLGITNIKRVDQTAEQFLESNTQKFDLVYLDADRRNTGAKTFLLGKSTPDIISLLPVIFKYTERVMLKVSPLMDIHSCKKQLPFIKIMEVVSVNNEVKELLIHLQKGYEDLSETKAVDLSANEVRCAFEGKYSENAEKSQPVFTKEEMAYFYEPATALIKSELAFDYTQGLKEKLNMVGVNSQFYVSDEKVKSFFGRVFKIVSSATYNPKRVKEYCKTLGIYKANISKRNFPHSTDILRKQLQLKEGGDDYFFFTKSGNELLFFHCRKTD
ncbi:MAG: hypothetical protein IT247_08340 [Bacteroidia bacterium]|nr:hypothetical protein [Bacteroidia bacterium]